MASGDLTNLPNLKGWINVTSASDDALLSRLIASASQYIQSWLNRKFAVQAHSYTCNGTGSGTLILPETPIVSVDSLTIDGNFIQPSPDGRSFGYTYSKNAVFLLGYIFPMGLRNVVINYTSGFKVSDEFAVIPLSGQHTLSQTVFSEPWAGDISVSFQTGVVLVKVDGVPDAGQYSCTLVSGLYIYTFSHLDAGKSILVSYSYTPREIEQACIELVAIRYKERNRIGESSKSMGGETVSFMIGDFPDSVRTILNNYKKVVPVI